MKDNPTLLFLYSEIGPYNLPVFKCLVEEFNSDIHVVRWDKNCLKPYVPAEFEGVSFYNRSDFDEIKLNLLIEEIKPDIIYVSGWMDNLYLKCILPLRKSGIPIVSGFDDVWVGSARQKIGAIYFKLFLNKYFTHAWVSGDPQYEYARRLGFSSDNIIFDLLTADVNNFSSNVYNMNASTFLYVGNFRYVKGTDILMKAFKYYREELNGNFKLKCIGNGDMDLSLHENPYLIIHNYIDQSELKHYISDCCAFILPSRHDQWGVVAHEFAVSGLPLIMSTGVGARSRFLINGFNGYHFENENYKSLANCMKKFESLSLVRKGELSEKSRILGQRISPRTSAANFVSLMR